MKFPWRTYAALGVGAAVVTMAGCAGGAGDVGASPATATIEFQTGLGTDDPTLKVLTAITKACAPEGVEIELVPRTNT